MTVRDRQVTRYDARFIGARHAVLSTTDRAVISCPESKQITVVNLANAAEVMGSLTLSRFPGAIAYLSSRVWTITKDGYVIGYSNADTPAQVAISECLYSASNAWLTTCNDVLVAPSRAGSVVSLDPSDASLISSLDDVLSDVAFAVGTSEYVYCFDGRGRGAVLAVDDDGALSKVSEFTAPDCQGVMRAHVNNLTLVVVVEQLETVATFDLETPLAPPRINRTKYLGTHLNSAMNNADHTALTDAERADPGLSPFRPIDHGIVATSDADIYLHADSGRLTYATSAPAVDLLASVPGGPNYTDDEITIEVTLAQEPTENQVITFSEVGDLSIVSGGVMTFTKANWDEPQFLVVQSPTAGEFQIPFVLSTTSNGLLTGEVAVEIQTAFGGTATLGPDDGDDQNYSVSDSGLDFASNFGLVSGDVSGGYVAINSGGANGHTYEVTVAWDLDFTADGVLEGGPHDPFYAEFRLAVLGGTSTYDSSSGSWTGTFHTTDSETTPGSTYVLKGNYVPDQAGAGTFTVTGSGSGSAVHAMDGGATLLVYYNAYDDAYAMTDELLGMEGDVTVTVVPWSWSLSIDQLDPAEVKFKIYAKLGSYPTEPPNLDVGAEFVANVDASGNPTAAIVVPSTADPTWKFVAVPCDAGLTPLGPARQLL